MDTDFIIDVTDGNFEYDVLIYSQNTPVVAVFWAAWSKPSVEVVRHLEQLAENNLGAFRLARIDIDNNPSLTLMFGIRTAPTLKAFTQGVVTGELIGAAPESRILAFLENLLPPSPLTLSIQKGNGLYQLHRYSEAEKVFREILSDDPENGASRLGLARALLAQGKTYAALDALTNFPASKEYSSAELLMPYAQALADADDDALPKDTPLDIAFANSINLAKRANFPAALDGLLDILRQDKRYRNGKAHQIILALLEMLEGDDDLRRQYRNELAGVLF